MSKTNQKICGNQFKIDNIYHNNMYFEIIIPKEILMITNVTLITLVIKFVEKCTRNNNYKLSLNVGF